METIAGADEGPNISRNMFLNVSLSPACNLENVFGTVPMHPRNMTRARSMFGKAECSDAEAQGNIK